MLEPRRAQNQEPTYLRRGLPTRCSLSILILVLGCGGSIFILLLNSHAASLSSDVATAALPVGAGSSAAASTRGDFPVFPHTQPGHARLPCLLCHQRGDNSPRPKLPGHTPCTGCHAQQFADARSPICTICHTDPGSGAVKSFPPLKSFNMVFDHARHTATAGLRASCATCHKPTRRGVALSIPSRQGAHPTCFQCHGPNARSGGRDLSSCNTCHHIGGYARTSESSQAERVNFSHAKHGAGARLNCHSCHQVRAGAPQRRQVTAPVPQEHNRSLRAQNCMTCHNGQRAFGGYDFSSCKRCHTAGTFRF
jgi:c(7)-type cytochrome triheme protein